MIKALHWSKVMTGDGAPCTGNDDDDETSPGVIVLCADVSEGIENNCAAVGCCIGPLRS